MGSAGIYKVISDIERILGDYPDKLKPEERKTLENASRILDRLAHNLKW